MNQLQIIGLSHKTVDLTEIGQFILPEEEIYSKITSLVQTFHISEIVYLATCNRLEFIFYGKPLTEENKLHFIRALKPSQSNEFYSTYFRNFFHYSGIDAVRHIYEVSASLDSVVLGEGQIFGQLKKSFNESREMGFTGDYLRILFQNTIEAGKEVYTKTEINKKPVSVVSVACKLMQDQMNLSGSHILIIGAGETNQLIGKYIQKLGYASVTVANRTFKKAEELAKVLDGTAIALSKVFDHPQKYDLIITCTGATKPLLTKENLDRLNGSHPVLIMDLAVPNDVDSRAIEQKHVDYIHVEHVRQYCKKNSKERQFEIDKALEILDDYIIKFKNDLRRRRVETAFQEVPKTVKEIHSAELTKIFRGKMKHLSNNEKELIEEFTNHLAKKFIQIPMKMAKEVLLDEHA